MERRFGLTPQTSEKSYSGSLHVRSIHEFRRAVESTNPKKSAKLLPQLQEIYNRSKDHLTDPDFSEWLNQQKFELTLGLKSIVLMDVINSPEFARHFVWMLSEFDPTLDQRPPVMKRPGAGMPFSAKQMKVAMRQVKNLDEKRLTGMMQKVPQSQIESISQNPAAEEMINKLKENKQAQVLAEKVKNIQEKKM